MLYRQLSSSSSRREQPVANRCSVDRLFLAKLHGAVCHKCKWWCVGVGVGVRERSGTAETSSPANRQGLVSVKQHHHLDGSPGGEHFIDSHAQNKHPGPSFTKVPSHLCPFCPPFVAAGENGKGGSVRNRL